MPLQENNQEGLGPHIIPGLKISIDIELKDNVRGKKTRLSLASMVEEIMDNNSLLIHMPIHQGYHYALPTDEAVLMKFVVDLAVFGLPIQFVRKIERDDLVYAEMLIVGKLEEHQLRDCYRLPCNLDVVVIRPYKAKNQEILNHMGYHTKEEDSQSKSRMINLSDGGMLLATNEKFERGEKINLSFNIGQTETIYGIVLRTDIIHEGMYRFKAAIQFLDFEKGQRQRFYKYIVNKQLEERRRRL